MKTYRALSKGYDGQTVIKAGELFTTSIPAGSWMEEVVPEPAEKSKPKGRQPADESDG